MFDRVTRCTGSFRSRVGRLAVGCLLAAGLAGSAAAQTPVNTAFTYQGQLSAAGSPINGTADLNIGLFGAATGGGAIGTVNLTNVPVTDGLFTAQLNFGNGAFSGNARWLEIAVRSPAGSGSFTTLTPRQPLTAAPYAASLVPGARITGAPGGLFAGVLTIQATQPGIGFVAFGSSVTDTGIFGSNGDASSYGALGTGEWGVYGTNTNGGFAGYFETGNAYFGGNVGIGTTTPTSKLDVAGTIETDGFKLTGNGAAAGRVLTSDAAGVATWQTATGGSQWITNGNNIGYTAGNVGIGNTTPHPSFRLQTTGGSGPWRGAIAATGTTNSAVMGEANGVATIGGHNAALSAWSNLSINPGGGNVGIGTTTPDMALDLRLNDIVGSSATSVGQHDVSNRGTKVSFGHRVFGTSEFVGMRTLIGAGTNGCGNTADIRFDTWECGTSVSREVMRITGGGEVGIGTSTPASKLDVAGMVTADDLTISSANFTAALVESSNTLGTWLNLRNSSANGRYWQLISTGSGNGQGAGKLLIGNGTSDGFHSNAITVEADGDVGIGTSTPAARLDVIGTARVSVLQITGGSDVAEPFNVNAERGTMNAEVKPGTVVTIDPERLGELRISSKAFDRTVAGIVSGANGVNPGMVLSQTGTVADGKHPVALTGRVWCWCDADAAGAIAAGDMLTTSDMPGHAMRVADHDRAAGAVIGKAMSSLNSGKGLVLVLVSLQ